MKLDLEEREIDFLVSVLLKMELGVVMQNGMTHLPGKVAEQVQQNIDAVRREVAAANGAIDEVVR